MPTQSPAAPSLKQAAMGDLEHELRMTRTLLERVPDDRMDYRPHPKSMPLGSLAMHVATLPYWIEHTVGNDAFDLASDVQRNEPPKNRQDVLDAFDARVAAMRAALDGADDAALLAPWELRMGPQVLQRMPKLGVIRSMGINHFIHHRAQLGVYLRMLDVPLPPLYGPSADEQPNFG